VTIEPHKSVRRSLEAKALPGDAAPTTSVAPPSTVTFKTFLTRDPEPTITADDDEEESWPLARANEPADRAAGLALKTCARA